MVISVMANIYLTKNCAAIRGRSGCFWTPRLDIIATPVSNLQALMDIRYNRNLAGPFLYKNQLYYKQMGTRLLRINTEEGGLIRHGYVYYQIDGGGKVKPLTSTLLHKVEWLFL